MANLQGVRIARVSTVPFFVVTQLKSQITMLAEHGAQVSVITSPEPASSLLSALGNIKSVSIYIPRAISPAQDVIALIRLFLYFRRARIQIAHSTTPKAGLLSALAARLAGVPIRIHTFTGQPWISMTGLKKSLMIMSEKLMGRLCTRCYADSKSQREFLISQNIVDAARIFVLGEGSLAGVDLQRFDKTRFSLDAGLALRQSLGIPPDAPVILFLGRITIDKGVRELVQAYQAIKSQGSNAHLLFVGPFDTESGVAGSISKEDIDTLVHAHTVGHTNKPEDYLAIADILCLPSYREGFGTVVIEAAAMGVPAVGTHIYGLSDAIIHNETGLLVPPKNVAALADALNQLLVNDALRQHLGDAAKRRARALFNADDINKQMMEAYSSLLQK